MLKNTIIGLSTAVAMSILFAGSSFAASNPAGTGQPGTPTVSCGVGNASVEPRGLTTFAFLNTATLHYAGSPGTPSLQNGSSNAVSQYDIACYQFTTNH